MTFDDLKFLKKVFSSRVLQSPCLEIGSAIEGYNVKDMAREAGLEYFGADITASPSVDFVVDFQDTGAVRSAFKEKQFGAIFILSVLEHVFDPIKVLDNALTVTKPGGALVIITPCVLSIHNFPIDCWRINPGFYKEYAKRRDLLIVDELFDYTGFGNVKNFENLPRPVASGAKFLWSKIIHRVFNTYGRGINFPSCIAVGVVLKKKKET